MGNQTCMDYFGVARTGAKVSLVDVARMLPRHLPDLSARRRIPLYEIYRSPGKLSGQPFCDRETDDT